jgi:hypothetical protein
MGLPSVSGGTVAEVKDAMQTDSAKSAVKSSLVTALGVDSSNTFLNDVDVVVATRRLADVIRRLNTGSMHMNVDYEVHLSGNTSDASAANALAARMTNIGNSSSGTSQSFANAFTSNLAAASSGSSVLADLSSAVQTNGLTIVGATTPTVTTRTVPITQTASADFEPSDGDGLTVGEVIAIILGSLVGLFVLTIIAGSIYFNFCKKSPERVEELPLFHPPIVDPNSQAVERPPPNHSPRDAGREQQAPPNPPQMRSVQSLPLVANNVWDDAAEMDFDPAVLAHSISSVVAGSNRPRQGISNTVPILQADEEREASIDAAINAVRARALAKAPPQPPGQRAITASIQGPGERADSSSLAILPPTPEAWKDNHTPIAPLQPPLTPRELPQPPPAREDLEIANENVAEEEMI